MLPRHSSDATAVCWHPLVADASVDAKGVVGGALAMPVTMSPPNASLVALGDKEAALSRASAATAVGDDGSNFTAIIPHELTAFRAWHVEKDYAGAITYFAAAVAANDANIYMEPPRWYHPTRHCLGAALVRAPSRAEGQNATRALDVFATDLSSFVENPWSLYV